jgi:hypothetical protein
MRREERQSLSERSGPGGAIVEPLPAGRPKVWLGFRIDKPAAFVMANWPQQMSQLRAAGNICLTLHRDFQIII